MRRTSKKWVFALADYIAVFTEIRTGCRGGTPASPPLVLTKMITAISAIRFKAESSYPKGTNSWLWSELLHPMG